MNQDSKNQQNQQNQSVLTKLKLVGLGDVLAERALDFFGNDVVKVVEENPYDLMKVEGISFTRSDKVASMFGVKKDDPRRHRAIILKLLEDRKNFGDTYLEKKALEKEIKKISASVEKMDEFLDDLTKGFLVVQEGDRIFSRRLYDAECYVARHIKGLRGCGIQHTVIDHTNTKYDQSQRAALDTMLKNPPLFLLTGGPGTGKSTILKAYIDTITSSGQEFLLIAPTGKAAQRMQETTGHTAKTIHRALGASYTSNWKYNSYNKLPSYDVVVIDESSMLDIELLFRVCAAMQPTTRLVLVGDVDQLPPIGPGTPFRDLLKHFPQFQARLTVNHRQGPGSTIADAALTINKGGMRLPFSDDLIFIEAPNAIIVREKIADIYKQHDLEVVLTPQKLTLIGTEDLNTLLRFKINTNARTNEMFSVGDRVMQTVNDYNLDVFNGTCGIVRECIKTQGPLGSRYYTIEFDDGSTIHYPVERSLNLMLAYASTVHKFQGSEAARGAVVCSTTHTYMLTRNLFYTALTRFREKCVVVGDRIALKRAITNVKESGRKSMLLERLGGG